ncbi:methyl-accepting chemotaxis protein [Terasakiella sp. A23]|uniref:methyl-accepting chemotaxis protein n=1 Tax=Terasakiella sp. FCG-A23 TaxID=3080561 RepID=UPI002952C3AF|nr:methyl-accepting chemotaxis protein [Terasakiella sp. A23]MDV7340253.1 methyl-accepting chemotaxis protein [Terasakiella sp. A23]
MYWTIRKIMALIGVFSTAVMITTLIWLSNSYEKFSVKNFNDTSGEIASFLVQQNIAESYYETIFPIANKWSRDRVLLQGARENDLKKLEIGASEAFRAQEVVNKIVLLRGVHVFDKELKDLTFSQKGIDQSVLKNASIFEQLKKRDKAAQRKPIAFTWRTKGGAPVHSLIMPIGGFKVAGYIEIITDPLPQFKQLGSALSGDVQLLNDKKEVLLESKPDGATKEEGNEGVDQQSLETLFVDVPASTGDTWMTVSLTRDISEFKNNLLDIRNQAISIVGLALVICAVGGWVLLRFAVFSKLKTFADAMKILGGGNTAVEIPPTGKDEFRTMASALEQLRESVRQAYRRQRIIDTSASCIVLCDLEGKLNYANTAAREFLNLGVDNDVSGKSADVFAQGGDFVARLLNPDNLPHKQQLTYKECHIELDTQAVLSMHGNHVSTMLSWTDITQQAKEREFSSKIMEEVTAVAQVVAEQAKTLEGLSTSLDAQSHETVTQAHQAKGISERNRASAASAADTTGQLNTNFSDMAGKTTKAQETAEAAISVAKVGDQAVMELENSSSKIGEVTRMISDIASQTRLLALNATIEAQRAGESGKGFAVVADEVGRLAGLTSDATDEISQTITDVQNQVVDAKSAIGEINDVISQIHDIQFEVSSTVAQQESLTVEISSSMSGITDGSSEIDQIVNAVGGEAEKTGDLANDLRGTSTKLSEEAANLQSNIDKYLKHLGGAA